MITLTNSIQEISHLLYFFMVLGVIASSISGAIRAIESKMDITGAILLAFINSNAGGTVRDLILNTSIFWVIDHFYIWITLGVGAATFIIIYFNREVINNRRLGTTLIITDAMGLAAFSLAGVQKSLSLGQNNIVAIMMGVWTAIGGGVTADIIANRVPLVFSQELYMSVAFIGSVLYMFIVNYTQIDYVTASAIAAIIMILIRLCSVKFNWRFPTL